MGVKKRLEDKEWKGRVLDDIKKQNGKFRQMYLVKKKGKGNE